jgi:hypothetical protein
MTYIVKKVWSPTLTHVMDCHNLKIWDLNMRKRNLDSFFPRIFVQSCILIFQCLNFSNKILIPCLVKCYIKHGLNMLFTWNANWYWLEIHVNLNLCLKTRPFKTLSVYTGFSCLVVFFRRLEGAIVLTLASASQFGTVFAWKFVSESCWIEWIETSHTYCRRSLFKSHNYNLDIYRIMSLLNLENCTLSRHMFFYQVLRIVNHADI